MTNLKFINSPQYHVDFHDVLDVYVSNVEVHVDVDEQLRIYRAHNALDETSGLPIFPLNTGECPCRSFDDGGICAPGFTRRVRELVRSRHGKA